MTYILETGVRFAASVVAVVLGFGSAGIAGAIAVSFVAAWWLARAAGVGLPAGRGADRATWRELAVAGAAAAAALLGQAILANSDVVFVKGAFAPEAAGVFAAIALVGRAIFFATTSLTMALFPVVASRAERGQPHHRLLWLVLAAVVTVCGSMTAVAWVVPELVLGVFFGEAYTAGAELLGPYALAISMLVGASVIAMYRLSLGCPGAGYLTLAAGLILIGGLAAFADGLASVVQIMLIVNSALLLATALEAGLLSARRPLDAGAPA
jgi:O-antigen/teichoic acid export membrane protein